MSIRISVSADDLPRVLRMIKAAGEDIDVTVMIAEPQQQAAGADQPQGPPVTPDNAGGPEEPGGTTQIPPAAMGKLTTVTSPHDRARLVSFIERQISEHEAVVDPGPDHLKYVRLHLPGHRGAYCYPTTRGFIDFRLEPEDREGCTLAYVRRGDNHGAPYSVRLRLDSDAAMGEALALARTAVSKLRGAK